MFEFKNFWLTHECWVFLQVWTGLRNLWLRHVDSESQVSQPVFWFSRPTLSELENKQLTLNKLKIKKHWPSIASGANPENLEILHTSGVCSLTMDRFADAKHVFVMTRPSNWFRDLSRRSEFMIVEDESNGGIKRLWNCQFSQNRSEGLICQDAKCKKSFVRR